MGRGRRRLEADVDRKKDQRRERQADARSGQESLAEEDNAICCYGSRSNETID